MKREELEARHFSWGFGEGYFYSKEQADSVMGAMEARIKEIEADKLRQENYCESLVNENKRLNEIIISKDMVGAELHNENKALRHNLEDWKAENEALKARIKELEEKLAMKLDPALYPNCNDCECCKHPASTQQPPKSED